MNDDELLRYSRHILLDGFDIDGQQQLLQSRVLIVGAGGLGCPAALYLAAAGVGRIILCDDDVVELSNLQRQIGHRNASLGMAKTASLAAQLRQLNPALDVVEASQRLTVDNALPWIEQADVVLDCSDNFSTRFLLNRLCVAQKKPLVSGAAVRTEGQLAVFDLRQPQSACYACLYSEQASASEDCSRNGVLSPLVGIIGSWQAAEAIKLLTGFGQPTAGMLLALDLNNNQPRRLTIHKDPACRVCHAEAVIHDA